MVRYGYLKSYFIVVPTPINISKNISSHIILYMMNNCNVYYKDKDIYLLGTYNIIICFFFTNQMSPIYVLFYMLSHNLQLDHFCSLVTRLTQWAHDFIRTQLCYLESRLKHVSNLLAKITFSKNNFGKYLAHLKILSISITDTFLSVTFAFFQWTTCRNN